MFSIMPIKPNQPLLTVCNGQLLIDVDFEPPAKDFDDNVRIAMREECPQELRMLDGNGIAFTLTSGQARTLAQALLVAAEKNDAWLAEIGKG
jgi:hypothetical protein